MMKNRTFNILFYGAIAFLIVGIASTAIFKGHESANTGLSREAIAVKLLLNRQPMPWAEAWWLHLDRFDGINQTAERVAKELGIPFEEVFGAVSDREHQYVHWVPEPKPESSPLDTAAQK